TGTEWRQHHAQQCERGDRQTDRGDRVGRCGQPGVAVYGDGEDQGDDRGQHDALQNKAHMLEGDVEDLVFAGEEIVPHDTEPSLRRRAVRAVERGARLLSRVAGTAVDWRVPSAR